jgi:hypothetical protein
MLIKKWFWMLPLLFMVTSCGQHSGIKQDLVAPIPQPSVVTTTNSSISQTANNNEPTVTPNQNVKLIISKSVGTEHWDIYQKNGGIIVYYSDDKGNRVSAALPLQDGFKNINLSSDFFLPVFNEKGPSWLLLHSDMSSGSEEKHLFVTKNKGKTWEYVGKMPSTGYVNGITFRNENEGWAGFEYYGDYLIPLYRTLDGGKTWDKKNIDLPKGYRYGNVYAPVFDPNYDLKGKIEIEFARENSDIKDTVTYLTSDGGNTWVKEKKL